MPRATPPLIRDVGDTALWMADVRAREHRRANAALNDALAVLFVNDRGSKIAKVVPGAAYVEWGVLMRTVALDGLLLRALENPVDAVIDLGAGFDARPYRLALPPQLQWFEIDLPQVVAVKEQKLSGREPRCNVRRFGMDLRDRVARRELLGTLCADSTRTVVLTEGMLPYLSEGEAAALAEDLRDLAPIRTWIHDYDNSGMRRPMPRGWDEVFRAAPIKLQVRDWFEFLARYGWQADAITTTAQQSEQLGRAYPRASWHGWLMRSLPRHWQLRILSATGVVAMSRNESKGAPKPSDGPDREPL
jgi:methyltransferase (TIGR00027 family)